MKQLTTKTVAIIVAHPDDETLWAGGLILSHPTWKWFTVCLSRASDSERAPRFYNTLKALNSEGIMGDLNDGPEQYPLEEKELEHTILELLPPKHFDLIISHNPTGEYTKHLRHEEISHAVITLWNTQKIIANELWTFAYEDGHKKYYPKPVKKASIYLVLPNQIWKKKYEIITQIYGFRKDSWEAETTPRNEAFWKFIDPACANKWLLQCGAAQNI